MGHKTTHRLLNKLWTRTYRNGRGMKGKQILPMELDAQVLVSRATSQVAPGTVRVADEYLRLMSTRDRASNSDADREGVHGGSCTRVLLVIPHDCTPAAHSVADAENNGPGYGSILSQELFTSLASGER